MRLEVLGCAVCAPGLPDWGVAAEVLRGGGRWDGDRVRDPAPVALPPNERRRLPPTARSALGVGMEALDAAGADVGDVVTVFTSCGSDGEITHRICESLARPLPEISPTRFHNSVHNAPGGYWSIALSTRAPSTSLCAYDGSFAAGLIEAGAQAVAERRSVLLVAYDLPYPPPLSSLWDVAMPFAAALVLAPAGTREDARRIDVAIVEDAPEAGWPASVPAALRSNPAAGALPLLALLAGDASGRAVLRYHGRSSVAVTANPR